MPASPTPLRRQPAAHPHALPYQCPYCDQPIPVERADEVRHRIEARECGQAEKVSAEIRQGLAREKAQGEAAGCASSMKNARIRSCCHVGGFSMTARLWTSFSRISANSICTSKTIMRLSSAIALRTQRTRRPFGRVRAQSRAFQAGRVGANQSNGTFFDGRDSRG
jgi:hypothetical protein